MQDLRLTPQEENTYASVINAPGSKRKRKAATEVQHPEAPRPKTPRRQEMTIQEEEEAGGTLREFERSFMSDQDDETLPPGVVDDGSVDPVGVFTEMLPKLGLKLQGNTKAAEHGSDCTGGVLSRRTWQRPPRRRDGGGG